MEICRFSMCFCEKSELLMFYHTDFRSFNLFVWILWIIMVFGVMVEIDMIGFQNIIIFTKRRAKSTELNLSFSKHSKFYSNSQNLSRTINFKKGFFFFEKWDRNGSELREWTLNSLVRWESHPEALAEFLLPIVDLLPQS